MRWITDNLKRAAWLIGAAMAVTVLTAIGADVVQLGLDVIGPHATTKNARAIVFTGSGVSTNTSAGGTNTVTISGGSGITTAVSTNLAAGLPTVVGSELRIGTNQNASASFSSTWVTVAGASDWLPFYSGNTTSNDSAPMLNQLSTYALGFGYVSQSNQFQDVFGFADLSMPFGATTWGSSTGLVFDALCSTNVATETKVDITIIKPDYSTFTTNGLVAGTPNTLTQWYIPTNSLGSYQSGNSTNSWRVRALFYSKNLNGTWIGSVRANVQ